MDQIKKRLNFLLSFSVVINKIFHFFHITDYFFVSKCNIASIINVFELNKNPIIQCERMLDALRLFKEYINLIGLALGRCKFVFTFLQPLHFYYYYGQKILGWHLDNYKSLRFVYVFLFGV